MTPEQALARILNRLQTFIPQNEIGEDIARSVNEEYDIIVAALKAGEDEHHALAVIQAEQKAKGEQNDVG